MFQGPQFPVLLKYWRFITDLKLKKENKKNLGQFLYRNENLSHMYALSNDNIFHAIVYLEF